MKSAAPATLVCILTASLNAATPARQTVESVPLLDEFTLHGTAPLGIEDFVARPTLDSIVISPDGTRLVAARRPTPLAFSVNTFSFPPLLTLGLAIGGLSSASNYIEAPSEGFWISGSQFLFQSNHVAHGAPIPMGGGILSFDLQNGPMRTAWIRNAAGQKTQHSLSDRPDKVARVPLHIVTARTGTPNLVLIQTQWASDDKGSSSGYGAFELNVISGETKRVALQPLQDGRFITGPGGRIAISTGADDRNGRDVYYLPPAVRAAGTEWQLRARSSGDEDGLQPVAWSGTGEEYFALDGRGFATRAVVLWDAEHDSRRELYRHPDVDLESAAVDATGRPWMFSGSGDHPVYWYPDPDHPLAAAHRKLVQQMPDDRIELLNATDDHALVVVRISSARRPPVFIVLDTREWKVVMSDPAYPRLQGRQLSKVQAVEFPAHDGTQVRGYLTTPLDVDDRPRKNPPLVVLAREDPRSAPLDNSWDFERQLLASRGYAVLQINLRGSRGRGAELARASDGRWGNEVQDDFATGVRWAIKNGVADASRICFFGSGFGAFSALTTVARHPALFRCAVGLNGVYDLPAAFGPRGGQQLTATMQRLLGQDLQGISPVTRAAAIKAKVLLVHHDIYPEFPANQSNRMRFALASSRRAPAFERVPKEETGAKAIKDRETVYRRIVEFLDLNLLHPEAMPVGGGARSVDARGPRNFNNNGSRASAQIRYAGSSGCSPSIIMPGCSRSLESASLSLMFR